MFHSEIKFLCPECNKIITTEDPIEYQLEGINQIQVNHKVGLTFAAGLRSILRHDPDVVLVGEIRDFKSIRFMRMFLREFDKPIVLRFATLDLIRGEWRRYTGDLREDGDYLQGEEDETQFEVNAVNVEENSNRQPIHYVLPPGIERETDYGTANLQQLNEQALAMHVCDLNDGETKAAFRNINLDIRQYKPRDRTKNHRSGSWDRKFHPAFNGSRSRHPAR